VKKKLFSIIIPVYQNEANLDETINTLLKLENKLPDYNIELILVNDGSTDNSFSILHEYHKLYPKNITIVNFTRNFGQTPAIRQGLKVANGNCVGIISADLQDPPELFIEMIKQWENGTKLVIAERKKREENFIHQYISGLYWKIVNKYAVKNFPKGGFDFCLLDKQVKDDLNKIGEKNTSIFPLIFWLGYSNKIISYTRRKRKKGVSQWTFSKKLQLTINTFINFTYVPVKFISFMGITISFFTFLYTSFLLVRWFFYGSTVQGWTSIALLISIFGGLILLSLGIVGEYLWRILDESRQRPSTIIDEIIIRKDN